MIQSYDGFPSSDDLLNRIDTLDRAMENSRLPESLETLRGLHDFTHLDGFDPGNPDVFDALRQLIGVRQVERGYMSTSLGNEPAVIDGNPYPYKINFSLPAGMRALWMGTESHYRTQRELILPRDMEYIITNVSRNPDGSIRIDAEVVNPK
nr:ADP-ribosyltransferase [Streptomonospora nanhaiensis]